MNETLDEVLKRMGVDTPEREEAYLLSMRLEIAADQVRLAAFGMLPPVKCPLCGEDPPMFRTSVSTLCDGCTEQINQERDQTTRTPRNVPLRIRRTVLRRDGFKCVDCKHTDKPLHVDHIIPLSRGGTNHLENLQTLCDECNLGKGDELEHEA